jgi:hypothetical protein
VISLPSIQGRIVVLACPRLLRKVLYRPGKKIQVNLGEPSRIMAEDGGHLITLFVSYLCKCFIISYLEARGLEPLFPMPSSTKIQERLYPRGSRESRPSWKWLDGAGCY